MLNRERGDTLIEVIFATAILALILVIAITIMNVGTNQTERAVEGTFVRQAIDSQSEILRYQRDSYIDHSPNLWSDILAKRVSTPPDFNQLASNATCIPPSGEHAFYLKPTGGATNGGYSLATDFAQPAAFASAGNGVWIEATSDATDSNYLDFYIYACWSAPGSGPNSTSGTIVRLYAPAQ